MNIICFLGADRRGVVALIDAQHFYSSDAAFGTMANIV